MEASVGKLGLSGSYPGGVPLSWEAFYHDIAIP